MIRPRCYARLQRESRCLAEPVIEGLPAQLRAGDLLVFNDTRATGVRLFGRKATGGTGRRFCWIGCSASAGCSRS